MANTSLFDIHDAIERLPGAIDARKKMVQTTLGFLDRPAKTSGNDPKVLEVPGRLGPLRTAD